MKDKVLIAGFVLFGLMINTFPQKGVEDGSKYGKGKDSIRCVKHLSLYREYVKQKNYEYAIAPWRVVFNECPTATKNIYIDGAKIYNHFIVKEQDPQKREKYIDTLMMVYDQRIKYYKEEGNILGRKGVDLLRYKRNDPESLKEGYGYLDKSVSLRKNKSSIATIATYMMATFSLFQTAEIDTAQVIKNYVICNDILDSKLDEKVPEVKETIFGNFVASGAGTCASIVSYYEPQFEEKKDDLAYLKNVTNLLSAIKCEEEDLFGKTAVLRYPKDPSAEAARAIAEFFVKKEDFKEAAGYYKKATELETDSLKKANDYNKLAIIHMKLGQYSSVRTYAYNAINLKKDFGEPYLWIGLAYASSSKNCGDDFQQKTVYWAAVDKFYQAKAVDPNVAEDANKYISSSSGQFPNKEELFFRGITEGSEYTVGCWINENTKARARK